MKKGAVSILLSLGFFLSLQAQDSLSLTLGRVLALVQDNHPVAKQASLLPEEAGAYLLKARGSFDPKLQFQQSNKYYNGSNYYEIKETGLKIPTWFGLELAAGWESAKGSSLNPEDKTPAEGLSYAGASLPLLRNLITDQRRTQLKQAKLMREGGNYAKNVVLNELAAEVIETYLQWYTAWREVKLYEQGLQLSQTRLQAIVSEFQAGGRAAVDTIETALQVQNFAVALKESRWYELKWRLMLSAHLWNGRGEPLEPEDNTIPAASGLDALDSLVAAFPDSVVISNLAEQHPEVVLRELGLQSLQLDYRLQRQNLLPDIQLKYQSLSNGWFNHASTPGMMYDNYRFGLHMGSSLFLRKERGEYKLSRLKLQGTTFKFGQKNRELTQKIKSQWQQERTLGSVYSSYDGIVSGYEALYNMEIQRFQAGDGTLFLLNTREQRLVESRQKQIGYYRKWKQSQSDYLQQSGVLWNLISRP
ncbi:MAG: TolC family protein [Bacteroidetes bacterium]|nr:TolC family protein [Bacteroidota bacterium]